MSAADVKELHQLIDALTKRVSFLEKREETRNAMELQKHLDSACSVCGSVRCFCDDICSRCELYYRYCECDVDMQ